MSRLMKAASIFLMAMSSLLPASAQQAPLSASTSTQADPAQANALLLRMAEHLAKAQQFTVSINAGFDVVQASGQKIEFGEARRIFLSRPDHLRVDMERSNGERQQVFFDGKDLTIFHPKENILAKLAKAGSVDDIVQHLAGELRTPIPLSVLLVTTLPRELATRVTAISLVERTTIGGKVVDHLAARTAEVDFQAWITPGDQPVPLRIVITYKKAPGAPQFWATLSDWNVNPQIDPSAFVLVAPAGAESVPFMVPVAVKGVPSGARR
jgi:hypothetical protein